MTQPGYGDTVGTNEYLPQALGRLAGSSTGDDATSRAEHALGQLGNIQDLQHDSKWGAQPGPGHFKKAYHDQLLMIADGVTALKAGAQKIFADVDTTARALTASNEQSASDFGRLSSDSTSTSGQPTW